MLAEVVHQRIRPRTKEETSPVIAGSEATQQSLRRYDTLRRWPRHLTTPRHDERICKADNQIIIL